VGGAGLVGACVRLEVLYSDMLSSGCLTGISDGVLSRC
jgi:hypothetical protein